MFQVIITVTDVNDNSPSFDRHIYQGSISRNARVGTKIGLGKNVIRVTDPDLGDKIEMKVRFQKEIF